MNKEYDFQLPRMFFQFDKFKEKFCSVFINMVHGSRLGRAMRFKSYCIVEFPETDKRFEFPHIMESDKFNRLKTNCMEFDIDYEDCRFNKVFVYHSICSHKGIVPTGFYSVIFNNTENGDTLQIPNISYEIEALHKAIQQVVLIPPKNYSECR